MSNIREGFWESVSAGVQDGELPIINQTDSILALRPEELADWCESHGQPRYRGNQIARWLYRNRAADFSQMQEVPLALREALAEQFSLFSAQVVDHRVASDRTEKLLLRLTDGEHVECVLMREPDRQTVCISTQVGCAMGCVFCASGLAGVKRNLTTAEILEQILRLVHIMDDDEQLTNIVVMGIGEPLANLRALLPALDRCVDEQGLGMSPRRITVSTVGLPAKIRELADVGRPYNLAVSLHAPNDRLRDKLVPVNASTGLDAILAAADEYFEKTGRRVTYEYVLLSGVNDQPEHAGQLASLLHGRNAHVNLIPMNAVDVLDFQAPGTPSTHRFRQTLIDRGINATVRKRKGADIDAACGQLRLANESPAAR